MKAVRINNGVFGRKLFKLKILEIIEKNHSRTNTGLIINVSDIVLLGRYDKLK